MKKTAATMGLLGATAMALALQPLLNRCLRTWGAKRTAAQ